MAKFSTVANEWAKKFILSADKKYTLNSIIYDMNYLVYSSNKQPLSYADKSAIFTHIFDIIAGRLPLEEALDNEVKPNFSDVVLFFEKRNYILKNFQCCIKKQAELN